MKGHKTRFSDSSLYDEICTKCGATDAIGDNRLDNPCGQHPLVRGTKNISNGVECPNCNIYPCVCEVHG